MAGANAAGAVRHSVRPVGLAGAWRRIAAVKAGIRQTRRHGVAEWRPVCSSCFWCSGWFDPFPRRRCPGFQSSGAGGDAVAGTAECDAGSGVWSPPGSAMTAGGWGAPIVALALAVQAVIAVRVVSQVATGGIAGDTMTPASYLPPVGGGDRRDGALRAGPSWAVLLFGMALGGWARLRAVLNRLFAGRCCHCCVRRWRRDCAGAGGHAYRVDPVAALPADAVDWSRRGLRADLAVLARWRWWLTHTVLGRLLVVLVPGGCVCLGRAETVRRLAAGCGLRRSADRDGADPLSGAAHLVAAAARTADSAGLTPQRAQQLCVKQPSYRGLRRFSERSTIADSASSGPMKWSFQPKKDDCSEVGQCCVSGNPANTLARAESRDGNGDYPFRRSLLLVVALRHPVPQTAAESVRWRPGAAKGAAAQHRSGLRQHVRRPPAGALRHGWRAARADGAAVNGPDVVVLSQTAIAQLVKF